MVRRRDFLALPAAGALLLGARAPKARAAVVPPALQAVIEGAKREGAISLEFGTTILGAPQGVDVAVEGVKRLYGVDIKATFTPGPTYAQMASLINTEREAGQPASSDIYYGTAVQISPYARKGLFRKIPWAELYPGRITPEIVEADGQALRITTGLSALLYNLHKFPQFERLTTTDDMLKPEFKDMIFSEPYLAGFDVLVADGMWGYAKTQAFIEKFSAQIGGLMRCGDLDRIASGEVPALAIDCGNGLLPMYRGVIGQRILRDAAMKRYDYLCIPVNAKHPNAAILYALYVSSPEGQKRIMTDIYANQLDSYPETNSHEFVVSLEQQGWKFQDVTISWWSSQKNIESDLQKLIKIVTEH